MTQSLFDVHFTRIERFLAELNDDLPDDVLGGIVRVALVNGKAPGDPRLSHLAHGWLIEASYISTRQQLVKVAEYCGWKWEEPRTREQLALNAEVDGKISERRELLRPLLENTSVKVRHGVHAVAEGMWAPNPDTVIDPLFEEFTGGTA